MTADFENAAFYWADGDILGVLHRRQVLAQSISQIANVFGVSGASIKGVLHRARHCNKPGSRMAELLAEHDRRMAAAAQSNGGAAI